MKGRKKIVIIAGPNGAGKTTFAREFLPREAGCPDFINVDLIAAGLSPFNPDRVALRAGRLMLQEISPGCVRGRVSLFAHSRFGCAQSFGTRGSGWARCVRRCHPASLRRRTEEFPERLPETGEYADHLRQLRTGADTYCDRRQPMSKRLLDSDDPDIVGSYAALRRAARRALQIGLQTGTPVYVLDKGRIVDLTRRHPRKARQR
jgi:hypothetical protein